MKRVVLVAALLLAGAFVLPSPVSGDGPKDWTFMVYMDGDNTLSFYTTADLEEMRMVGSDSDINILVLVDYADASASIRYIRQAPLSDVVSSPSVANIASEPNMADASNLVKFVQYGVNNYPADRYAVILWNHGAGWIGFNVDDTSEDMSTLQGLRGALRSIKSHIGSRVNLLGFDECLMQEVSVCYSVKDYVDIVVASQANEVANGWYYAGPLNQLSLSPTMNASVLGKWIVDYYDSTAGSAERTLSVIDCTALESLCHELNSLSRDLGHKGDTYHGEVYNSITHSEKYYAMADVVGYDLYDWMDNLDTYLTWSVSRARAVLVRSAINSTVYYEKHGSGCPNAHGISIYLAIRMNAYNPLYGGIHMSVDGEHDDLLWDYVRYVDGYTNTPAQPTMEKSGTVLYVNNSGSLPSGYGSMFKLIRGGWIESSTTTYSSDTGGVFYARTWNGVDYSDVKSSSFTGIRTVILEAGSLGYRMSFDDGWNLISIPTSVGTQASKFVDDVEHGVQVVRRTDAGKYKGYVGGQNPLGDDFSMSQSRGYYFYVDSTSSHLFSGSPGPEVYNLKEGWNLVGYSGESIGASAFCLSFVGVNTIVHRTSDGYQVYDEGLNIGDFYITKGMGFYLWSTDEEVVTL